MIALLLYDRAKGKVELTEFVDADIDKANDARLSAEMLHAEDSNIEIVILQSESLAELKKTHARYFKSLPELRELSRS